MMKKMRLLIAYEGSPCSDAAIEDLKYAGLPRQAEALIISVAENPEDKASEVGQKAARKIKRLFPRWKINVESPVGSPASVIIQRAEEWKADLIVLGAHGRSRIRWGSVSQTVAAQAHCSVRIGRLHRKSRNSKILICLDGSFHSKITVEKVMSRTWLDKVDIKILAVFEPAYSTGVVIDPNAEYHYQWLIKMVKSAEKKLAQAGLKAEGIVRGGNPKHVIVRKAQKWGVDCILVGAKGRSPIERLLFGSVSSAVAVRAPCSVEIIRQ